MACQHCRKIRTAILHGKMAEATGLTVAALRQKIGWKTPPEDQPVLDGMTKAELLTVADAEGADAKTSDTKADIADAIEANRSAE